MTTQPDSRNSETEFQYSDGIKGMEAVVAQLQMRYDKGDEWIASLKRAMTDEESAVHRGYRNALWDAKHALGTAKAMEKIRARRTPAQQAEHEALVERHRIERIHNGEAEDRGPTRIGMSQW